MEGDGRTDAEVYASAAAAVAAAAVAGMQDQDFHQPLAHAQLMGLQTHAEQEHDHDPEALGSPEAQARKPRKLRKPNDVARCQVDGCGRDLSDAKLYLRRYSVCEPHFKAEWVMLGGGRFRFCQQCNKFQPLDNFTGNRRSCKARSEDRNLRRRKQRTDERALTGDDSDPGTLAGRALLRMGAGLGLAGALAMPSRVALGDNGMLRHLGADPNDPTGLSSMQYAQQVHQFLAANSALGAGGLAAGLGAGGLGALGPVGALGFAAPMTLPALPPGLDLATAAALVSGELGGFGSPSSSANALSLLTAAAAAANGGGLPRGTVDPSAGVGGNFMLQQLQLAQLIAKGTGGPGGGLGGGGLGGLGGAAGASASAAASGLAAALGSVGSGMGLPSPSGLNVTGGAGASGAPAAGEVGPQLPGGIGGGAGAASTPGGSTGVLAQQLVLATAAAGGTPGTGGAVIGGGGGGGGGAVSTGGPPDGGGGTLDLQNLLAQQLLQQSGTAGPGPMLLLNNPMLLGLEQLLAQGAGAK